MWVRRLVWGLWLAFSLLLYLFENNTGTRALLAAAVLVPAFSVLCARLASQNAVCHIEAPADCRKGEEAPCAFSAELPGRGPWLLFSVIAAPLRAENLLSREEADIALFAAGSLRPRRTFGISAQSCGSLRLRADSVLAQDIFGLASFPVKPPQPRYITVEPVLYSVQLAVAPGDALSDSSERWSQQRPGSDPSETFAIREYVPGDPIRQIHWKLSQKADRLMIRELGLPVSDEILLMLETSVSAACRPQDTPAALEALLSISSALLEADLPHVIAWHSARLGEMKLVPVQAAEDLRTARASLLAEESVAGDDTVGQAFLKTGLPLFAHMAVFSARPDTDVVSLLGGGRVSLLLPAGIAGASAYGQVRIAGYPDRGEPAEPFYLEI